MWCQNIYKWEEDVSDVIMVFTWFLTFPSCPEKKSNFVGIMRYIFLVWNEISLLVDKYRPSGRSGACPTLRKSEWIIHMVKCVRVKGSSIETHTPALWNLIGWGVTPSPLPVYISAQRYSSATFVSLRFHSRKNRRAFKKYYYIKFHF